MRYLVQQMAAFFVIILTVLIIFGISFTSYTRRTITDSTYEQLEGYSNTIINNVAKQGWTLQQSLDTSLAILQNQQVAFNVLNPDLTVSYPAKFEGQSGANIISESELEILKQGRPVEKTIINKSISKSKHSTSLYVQPLFSSPNLELMGLLLVSKPNSSIDESVNSLTNDLFKGFILSTVIALLISYLLAKLQVNRIDRLKQATDQLALGNYDVHLEAKNNDELDELAHDFNQLAITLKNSDEEIKRQEERRRNFMADVAHEMRTPLTTINGLLEGLAYGAIPKDQEEKCLTLMQNETKRLIRLVNENLDYEKILNNQIKMVVQRFNATEVLDLVIEQLSAKAIDKDNKLVLLTEQPVYLYADYDRFVQVMVNIITNAIQFTENGTISVELIEKDKETSIHIKDTGIGMNEEQLKNIWDRYYKADPSRKNTKYGESGLGLSIVDQLVKLHGGHIEVDSKLGVGTTFKVSFPSTPSKEQEIKKDKQMG